MTVASFAEESCWEGDRFRQVRKAVTFRVTSLGKLDGRRVDSCFEADFGVWYDPEDDYLLGKLRQMEDRVQWDRLVYYKKQDHSAIEIFDPEDDDKLVARIVVRRRMGGDPSGEDAGPNVVCLEKFRLARAEKSIDE